MSGHDSTGSTGPGTYWVSGVLFLVAAALFFQPFPFHDPSPEPVAVAGWVTDPATVRHPVSEPVYRQGVFTYRCSDCHNIIPSPLETRRTLTQHSEIELRHGINAHCFNCHHRTNRDAFAGDQGEEIPWDRPEAMCAKCHGPVYRDWQHGVHGRTNGYWLVSRGPRVRRKCTECHDPHRPPFPPMHPAPGPNTLRMGPQEFPDHEKDLNPLRIMRSLYRKGAAGDAGRGE